VLHYWLDSTPSSPPELTILDDQNHVLRTYRDELAARPGLNQFVWNLRLPGAPNVLAPDLDPWNRPDGPLVLAGRYQARLTVGDRHSTVPVEVLPDPRVRTSRADLEGQEALLLEILGQLTRCNEAVNAVDRVLPRLHDWMARTDEASVREPAGEAATELTTVRGLLIDVHMQGAQLWPSGIHEKLNALFTSVDSADYAPPEQAREVLSQLTRELEDLLARLDAVESGPLQALEHAIREGSLPIIGNLTLSRP
jgi:hypothetical protein